MIRLTSQATPFFARACAALALLTTAHASLAAEGEIKKIDRAQAKVTLKHGEIANLDMPPMTMSFKARPPELLQGLAEGDQVVFEATKQDGQYVLTQIRKR